MRLWQTMVAPMMLSTGEPPAAWTPATETTGGYQPIKWFDASQITGLSDGNAISTWEDLGSLGQDATGTTTQRPTYKTNIKNGLPVARFAGGQLMTFANLFLDRSWTCFAVYGVAASTTTFVVMGNNTSAILPCTLLSLDGTYYVFPNGPNVGYFTYPSTQSGWRDCMIQDAGSTPVLRVKGNTISSNGGGLRSEVTALGAIGRFGSYLAIGDMAEILLYDASLDATDEAQVRAYLTSKWGL